MVRIPSMLSVRATLMAWERRLLVWSLPLLAVVIYVIVGMPMPEGTIRPEELMDRPDMLSGSSHEFQERASNPRSVGSPGLLS